MREKETIFTASVISYNSFEDIQYKLRLGIMATHQWIVNFAIEFEDEYSFIEEWETYLDENTNNTDWEEFLIEKVNERISQEMM